MESTPTKGRTPSRCRDWERNRRNKFNDAIARLGEIVKEINRATDGSKESENAQYPKVEIVEKAIVCLNSSLREKMQLKAEILALQVKIDGKENAKKDASTQVFLGFNKKKKNGKSMKVVLLEKSKPNIALKEKLVLSNNVTVESKVDNSKTKQNVAIQKLPILVPKSKVNSTKSSENTIVVLPAAPYIFPQRPIILPPGPPAFVLVESNLQTFNKPAFSVVNRNNGDITKTTMVNILPISAYSRPLSAIKSRRNLSNNKIDVKKTMKKIKKVEKVVKNTMSTQEPSKSIEDVIKVKEGQDQKKDQSTSNSYIKNENLVPENALNKVQKNIVLNNIKQHPDKNDPVTKQTDTINLNNSQGAFNLNKPEEEEDDNIRCTEKATVEKTVLTTTSSLIGHADKITEDKVKINKVTSEKEPIEKGKENKLPNILDSTLCENTVDGGNVRLELAEEFLATSPTAAFLMSFPLVSGNRADSPAEEQNANNQADHKENNCRRQEINSQTNSHFEKNHNNMKTKPNKPPTTSSSINHNKFDHVKNTESSVISKDTKHSSTTTTAISNENPFLNLTMSSLLPSTCTLTESTFVLDFDCNASKTLPSQSNNYASSNSLFYKSDPFNTVKNSIYSTSSISSGHEFNSFGLYPCAMEKYSSKTKSDYSNVEDNLMKMGSSRLTYDIDLGWSHKGFDFVNCTTAPNSFSKDSILNTSCNTYSSSYNPFNPEFHMPLVSTSNKKDTSTICKATFSVAETITSFYSQPSSLWPDDMNYYTSSNTTKTSKHQNYLSVEHSNISNKVNSKHYDTKHVSDTSENVIKTPNIGPPQVEKYTKKSPSKMHINWMTSEVRPIAQMQTYCNLPHPEPKEAHKNSYVHSEHSSKKLDHTDANYFPISMHNFSQTTQDEVQVWPSTRPVGTTEITIEPPPINLPTLVGDLALGPHDKKKPDSLIRIGVQSDLQNCSNYFSVSQLMNRTIDSSIPSRYQASENIETTKTVPVKQNSQMHGTSDIGHKSMSRIESHGQPYHVFHDANQTKTNSYETITHYPQSKAKTSKTDKNTKIQKNSYSAEALIRGGTCNQKHLDSSKFVMPSQKYTDFNVTQDSVAHVSHFPPILDYSDNSYTGQQYSATTLYNSTSNTISNSFYTNFMPSSSNLMSGNYTSGPFSGDFMDYNQPPDCNYTNQKYEDLKIRTNPISNNYKSSRRDSAAKHKLECSKKDSNKKYHNKRPKLAAETEEWTDSSHLLWQNKPPSKKHPNLVPEELPFPNYVGNQLPGQYQPEFFNTHLMPTNIQAMGHNVDRSIASFPATSRANFNLSTIFPEITMKVQ